MCQAVDFRQIQTLEIQEFTFSLWQNCQRQILFPSTFPLSFPFISFKISFTFTWKSSFDFRVAEFAPWQLLLPPRFSQIALRTSWLPPDSQHIQFFSFSARKVLNLSYSVSPKSPSGFAHLLFRFFSKNVLTLLHMGPEHASREKNLSMVIFLIFLLKNVSRIRFQEIKIRPWKGF